MLSLALALLSGANAAVVTNVQYVTQVSYEELEVYVDNNGNPWTTVTSAGAPPSTGVETSAPPASHSHAPNYNYITQQAASPAVETSVETSVETAAASPAETSPENAAPAAPSPAPATTPEAPAAPSPPPATTPEAPAAPSTPTTSPEAPAAPSTPTTSPEAPAAPSTPTTSPEAPAPPTTTSAQAPTTSSAPAPSSSSSGGSGETFNGEATFYEVGLGACGETNSDSEMIAALNHAQWDAFGSMSNGNPACGKQATLNYEGKSVTVTIRDKCMGCKHGDLDLSPAAFKQLADEGAGRIQMSWNFS